MKSVSCPNCQKVFDLNEQTRDVSKKVKGVKITYIEKYCKCPFCKENFQTTEQLEDSLLSARNALSTIQNDMSAEKIKKLRAKYGASQKAFGLILGMGELTISSYETGKSKPNATNLLLLNLAENPLMFYEMFSKNKIKIGIIQQKRILESKEMRNLKRWKGLEALYNSLSTNERSKVENRTSVVNGSVVTEVASIVKGGLENAGNNIFPNAKYQNNTFDIIDYKYA